MTMSRGTDSTMKMPVARIAPQNGPFVTEPVVNRST